MHALMSFLGTIGYNMKATGTEELVGAAYDGITIIFNGKAWPKAMLAFRMVVAAFLHDFLQEGGKVMLISLCTLKRQEKIPQANCG